MAVELDDDDTELDDEDSEKQPAAVKSAVDDEAEDRDEDGDDAAKPRLATVQAASLPRAATPLPAQVKARIAQCLRERLAVLEVDIASARALAEREHFYDGFLRVLEQRQRRWTNTLALAEQAPVLP